MKGISPLLAAVLLVAIVMAVGIMVASSISSIATAQKTKASNLQKCTDAGLNIEDVSCSNSLVSVVISNTGNTELSNFTLYIKIAGNIIVNNSPVNSNYVLKPGEGINLEAYTGKSGEIEVVKVFTKTCPGVSAEINNQTIEVEC